MQVHFTLLLASRACVLLQHFGDALEKAWLMPAGASDMCDTLARVLLARPQGTLSIMLDSETLDVRVDEMPPVAPWQRDRLAERQRGFHFPHASMAGSVFLKTAGGGHVLHAAADMGEEIRETLEKLYHIGNPIGQICFFPLEAMMLAAEMERVPPATLRIQLMLGEATGLRQTVVRDGLPLLTRLHTECTPGMAQDDLAQAIVRHVQSTRDFLPRIGIDVDEAPALQLFVPPCLKGLGTQPALQALGCQVVVLEAPRPDLVPPEWELDIALLARLALRRKRFLPFAPEALKARNKRWILREDVSIVMFVFGIAGIAFGLHTLLNPPDRTPPPAAFVMQPQPEPESLPPPAKEKPVPPAMQLDAVIYNGPADWSLWINGEKYTPGHQSGAVTILDVSPEGAHILWQKDGASQEMLLTPKGAGPGVIGE